MFVLVWACLFIGLSGCSRQASKEADIKINALKQKVAELSSQVETLTRDLETLAAENERLSGNYNELGEWADRTVFKYGKGVWYMEDLKYPFFAESMKKASLKDLIDHLNQRFARDKLPEVIYLDKNESTVIVGVSDDNQLARQMGSFGAASYMNTVVFSLASLDDVTCVTFKFEEGDHAVPGTYCRTFLQK